MANKFYMVYLENERTPTYKHPTVESAKIEAKRLSKTYGKKAYILVAIKSVELIEFKETNLIESTDELPF